MSTLIGAIAVITGAGHGLGRALALELASHGALLALADIDAAALEDTAAACRDAGAEARTHRIDVTDRDAVSRFAQTVVDDFGRVNLVINNAGVCLISSALEMSWQDYDWLMAINLGGVINCSQAFLPHLIASGDGHLVNLSSVAGLVGLPYSSAYNASKFAIRGYTEALAQEMAMAGHPVRVSCVHPGMIRTRIFAQARGSNADDRRTVLQLFDRLGRLTPEAAAARIVKGVLRGERRILIGSDAHLLDLSQRLLGSRYQQLNARLSRLLASHGEAGTP